MYTEAKLGQVGNFTPILNACVYYLIFGLLFETSRAVQHFPAFLVAGVFIFAFTKRSIVTGSTVMRANIQLIRALYFPRASLPLAYVIVELQQMLIGMVVVTIVMLASGQWPTWYWVPIIPAVLLQTMFNTGAALLVARMGGAVADVVRADPVLPAHLPLLLRRDVPDHHGDLPRFPTWVGQVLSLNPFAVYISLVRVGFMSSYRTDSAGNQPYNPGLCQQFLTIAGPPHQSGHHGSDHSDRPEQPRRLAS